MTYEYKESIHQEFERFMRDEMDDSEKKMYLRSKRYKKIIAQFSEILIEKSLKIE